MTEKFIFKDAKKGDFNWQMEFRKRSIVKKFGLKADKKRSFSKQT